MSGCAIWILNKDTINDNNPKYGLLGIFTSFFRQNKVWRFTKIETILKDAGKHIITSKL
jgi:hypothetical protein